MGRLIIPAAEAALDVTVPVLDRGLFTFYDYMGGDERVVSAARISYGEGTVHKQTDEQLIRYLLRNKHTSPFEQVILTYTMRMPIFVMRQMVRHRTARLNEYSGRYSEMPDVFYLPGPDELKKQGVLNKQGDNGQLLDEVVADKVVAMMLADQRQLRDHYLEYLDEGLVREIARIYLPLAQYTDVIWQMDLHNLIHCIRLRKDVGHAQPQILAYATEMARCCQLVAPKVYDAAVEYVWEAHSFGRTALGIVKELMATQVLPDRIIHMAQERLTSKSERTEFLALFGLSEGA